jgi:stage II sporulation protein D
VLLHEGRAVPGYCAASCGGSTTTPAELWGGRRDAAYSAVACRSCSWSPYFAWRRRVDESAVRRCLEALLERRLGAAVSIDFVRGRGGYVRRVVVEDGGRRLGVGGEAFRVALGRRLGWDAVPSPRYTASRVPGGYAFDGGGHGHGIGLCIAGAVAMARGGATRDEILARYFPKCSVARSPHTRD